MHASMNRVYRLVWSEHTQAWVAVPESGPSRGKRGRAGRLAPMAAGLIAMASAAAWAGGPLPTGGQVTQGQGSISQSGNTLTVNQGSNRLVTTWDTFNIAAGQTVRFVQPSASAVALSRVLGGEASSIQGQLLANGQVYLLNPNGVLFGAGARVDTAGLIASTLSMSDADFMAGRLRLAGSSQAGVRNEGTIVTREGGTVALIAAQVVNTGSIQADGGTVALASGQDVTLDLGGSVHLQVNQGTLDGLIANGGVIQADGGRILMTAKAADALSRSVINQTGVLRARTLSTGASGEILLLGDMDHGDLTVGGQIDATAPVAGHGGQIETSAAHVDTLQGLNVQAGAAQGTGGTWLIDPYDYTINATAAGNIVTALNGGTSVTVSTQSSNATYGGGASGSGDITVSSAIAKTSGGAATLTLRADRNILVNSAITSTSGALGITLSAANNASSALGGVNVGANLTSNGGRILIGGAGGNQTAATSYGIGYALNTSSSAPAVQVGTNVTINSGGGHITINGRTNATNNGSYSATKAGIYVLSGATIDSGGGNVYLSGVSSADSNVFGLGVEANSNTTTTFRSASTSGGLFVDAQNLQSINGALGLVNSGGQAKVQFWAPNVAYMLFRLNGSNQATTFTVKSPCQTGSYPYCGTIVVPGTNGSYLYASYNVTTPETLPIYVFTGNGSKTYDALTTASGVTLTSLGGPNGFSTSNLGTLGFTTASKAVGSYDTLNGSGTNPSTYTSGGSTYAVAYFNQGTYTIAQRAVSSFSAGNKVYDGTTAANVTGSGIINGDAVTVNATGGFASANVGNGITVNVTGVSLTGADAGNYSVSGGGSITTTANITPATLTVTAVNDSKTYNGLAYTGGHGVSYSGFVNNETTSALGGSLSYSGTSQNATNAGSYTIAPSGLTANNGNYTISYANGALTVNPATLTYTAGSATRTYGAANPALTGTLTGFVNNETQAGATTGTLAFTTTATSGSNVGSYGITGGGLTANNGNYTFVQAGGNTSALSVTPASLTVTAASDSKTYNGLAYTGGNGVSYSGFVNSETSSVLSGSLVYGGTSQNATNAGSYTIVPSGLSSGNYNIGYANGALTVNPATLTYTAGSATRTYGASNPTLTGTVTGFVHNETLSSATTGTLAFSTTATSGSNVGSYGITGSGLTANHGNYTLVQAGGNTSALTVNPATLTVTATNDSKTYDGQSYSGGNGVSYSGFVNGDTSSILSGSLSYGGNSQGAINAGSYAITPSGLSAGSNYNLSFVNGSLSITPAILAVITGNLTGTVSKVYNGNNTATLNSSNYLLSGWISSDGATVTKTSGTYDNANAGTGKTVTVSLDRTDFSATGSTNLNNYQLPTSVSGNVGTITRAALTLTATGGSKTYDGSTASAGTVSVSGLQGSDTLTGLSQVYANKNAGTGKTLSVANGYTLSDGNGGGNYDVTTVDATTGTITRASASVSGTATSVTYNGSTQTQTAATRSGFVNGDTITVSGTASGRNAGTYASNLSVGGSDASNYDVTVTNANLVIGRAALTLTAAGGSKTYDGSTASAGTVSVSGLQGSDTVSNLSQVYANKNAGTGKTLSVANGYTLSDGNGGGNYDVTTVDATTGTITRASASVSGTATSVTYNGSTQTQTAATRSGFVNGDTITVSGAASGRNAGTYASSLSVGGSDASNYDVTVTNANLVIGRAALTLTAAGGSKTYDGSTASSGTVGVSGLQGSDTVANLSQVYANKNAGTGKTLSVANGYTLSDGNSGGNYDVSTVDASNGVITRASASVSETATSVTYNGSTQTQAAATRSGFVNGDTITVSGAASGRNAGTYASSLSVGGADASNYDVTVTNANLVIGRAALTLTASGGSKTYDGSTASSGTVGVSGLQGSDTVANLTQVYANKNAGTGKTLSVANGYTLSDGNSGGNYDVSTVDATTGVITRAAASVTGTATSVTYNGSTQTQTAATRSGFVNGDTITVSGTASGRNAGTYASSLSVGGADASNYDVTVTNANLVIGRAALTLTATGGSKTYDGSTASAGTGGISGLQGSDTVANLTQVYANKNAGTGKTLSVANGYSVNDGNSGGNYDVSTVDATNGVVTPASLLLTVTPASRAAGTANPPFTGTVTGFVGGDTLANATQGQLSFQTTATGSSGSGSYAITGTGLTALHDNYVFVQAPGNAQALTLTAALPVIDQYLPKTAPVPNFPDNAGPALGSQPQTNLGSNLNYVSLSSTGTPTLATPAGGGASGGTSVVANAGSGPAAGGNAGAAPNAGNGTAPNNGNDTPANSDGEGAGNGRARTARVGVAATAVPSANGPLDVFVIDGGINMGGAGRQSNRSTTP